MNENLSIYFPQKNIVIVTEDYKSGGICVISANSAKELWQDWNGERRYVQSNESFIFSAFYKGELINPYVCKDFLSLLYFLDTVDEPTNETITEE